MKHYSSICIQGSHQAKWQDLLNLQQVEVYDMNGDNVAHGKPATQSSNYQNRYPTSNAVDGNTGSGYSHTNDD